MADVLGIEQFGHLNLSGWGVDTAENVAELNKALGTGQAGEAYGQYGGDMSVLRPQSLEATMKISLATERHVKLFKKLGKRPAYNTTEEYNRMVSFGGKSSPFMIDGGLPNEEDSSWERRSAMVKFLGTTRSITLGATLVRNVLGDMVTKQSQDGTTWLLKQTEHALFYGDSQLDPLQWDGLFAQIERDEPNHVIDMRGKFVNEGVFEAAAYLIATKGYGAPEVAYFNNYDKAALATLVMGDGADPATNFRRATWGAVNGKLGAPIKEYESAHGTIPFENNLFIQKGEVAPTSASSAEAPSAPTLSGAITAGADATSKFAAGDAGTHTYSIVAVNAKGWSTPVTGTVAVASGQAVTITVTNPAGVRYYKVYRSLIGGSTKAMHAFDIKATAGATTVIVDRNFDIPGTSRCLIGDFDPEQAARFFQLAPLMKLPLARISAAERFMILMFGMPVVYNAKRFVVIKNIGWVPGFDPGAMHDALNA
jgi:hypothetical protein